MGKGGRGLGAACPRIGWGRGETPKLCREGEGPAGTPPPSIRMRLGQPDPTSPSGVCAQTAAGGPLSHESLSLAEGCGAQVPLGWLEKGPAHSSAAALDQKALPNLLLSSLVFWDHPWRATGVSVLRGRRELGRKAGGGGCGGTPKPCWSLGCGTARTSLGVQNVCSACRDCLVSCGDGMWALHPSRLGWGSGDPHIPVGIRTWGAACCLKWGQDTLEWPQEQEIGTLTSPVGSGCWDPCVGVGTLLLGSGSGCGEPCMAPGLTGGLLYWGRDLGTFAP